MSGYFGNEQQRRLQAQAESAIDFIKDTPGACQTGRTMGCDNVDQLGWEGIEAFLERDGVFGFRLIDADRAERLKAELGERNFRFDTWDVFLADRPTAMDASQAILDGGIPQGLREFDGLPDPEGAEMVRLQSLMGEAGVVPFSGSMLVGALGPAATVALEDGSGATVAAAHGYLPHNEHSAFHSYAWGGLVAVAESQRGRGVGNYVNARMITRVFAELSATHIYELVSSSNIPSRRMVQACGLRHEPGLVCGVATPMEGARLTR